MDARELSDVLRELAFAEGFSPAAIEALAAHARLLKVRAGAVLFREGDTNDRFYLIRSGLVVLEMCAPARGCARLMTLGAGDLLAWSALVGGERMTASALVQQDAELVEISGSALRDQCDANHELGYQVMRRLAESLSKRLLATRLQLLDLFELEGPLEPEVPHAGSKT
jgi:CRP/FNR family cyclic AMP-dependent transcriptional regulator